MKKILTALARAGALAILIALPGLSLAQQEAVTHESEVTVKATIERIDHDTRVITLKDKDGVTMYVYAGPQVRRFDELKVGDVVTFHTTQQTVFQIRKPGEAAPPSTKDAPVIVRTPGAKPGGTTIQQETQTVTVKELDTKTPAVKVETEDGRLMSLKVNDKDLLNGLSAGDKVVITYTRAVAISVE